MTHSSDMQVRHHLSSNHLYSAYLFARNAKQIEQSNQSTQEQLLAHRSFVTSSVMSSVAFLEASVNELFAVCTESPTDSHVSGHPQDSRFKSIGNDTIAKLSTFWKLDTFQRNCKLLDKYQTALRLAGKPELTQGANPYQDAKLVVQLRNILVHFVPEERAVAVGPGCFLEPDAFELKYRGKFPYNLLSAKFAIIGGPNGPREADYPFFPEKCLGSGCAFWAFDSCLQFANTFFGALGTTWYYHFLFDRGLIPVPTS